MRDSLTIALLILTTLLATGCAGPSTHPDRGTVATSPTRSAQKTQSVAQRLEQQYLAWRGTPYRYGGLSRSGVDCSGFILQTFRTQFSLNLPRTTELQSRYGSAISRNRLRAGDLVFFDTGDKERHAGIYIANGQFIHASTSRGVIKSSLDNPYWQRHYWQSRRVLR